MRLAAGRKKSHEHPITAAGAEFACAQIRKKLTQEQAGELDPVVRFDAALTAGDFAVLNKLLSDAWFGVPESTSCWQIRGFAAAVDLMDDPPEDVVIEGERVEEAAF